MIFREKVGNAAMVSHEDLGVERRNHVAPFLLLGVIFFKRIYALDL